MSALAGDAARREAVDAEAWDAFLLQHTQGQFQQSSRWAEAKRIDGWTPVRRAVEHEGRIVGGFQILLRTGRLGRMGLCYKGPVAPPDQETTQQILIELLKKMARDCRLSAVVVQPPDASPIPAERWAEAGFLPNRFARVIASTLVIDLSPGLDAVRKGMRRTTRAEIRLAEERGVRIRAGTAQDLPLFFDLMAASCARQHTTPNPDRVEALASVWSVFHPCGRAQLFLAEVDQAAVAGMLCIGWGRRLVAWKRGWSGTAADKHPNQAVTFAAIRWAIEHGFTAFDFDAIDRRLAETLLHGNPMTDEQQKTRDFANLAFGGKPLLFPPSRLYIPNPVLRWGYRACAAVRRT